MPTEFRNCKNCNAVFASDDGALLCNNCRSSHGELYKRIREYIYEHPGISASELSAALNINVSRITDFIRSGGIKLINPREPDDGKK